MSFSISRLFHPKRSTKDDLTQPQREAIADLLHYCMYADNHIALAEVQIVNDVVGKFAWEPDVSFETFEVRSIASARAAKENLDSRKAFLDSIKHRLNTSASRALALDVCKRLFSADGVSPKESTLLAQIAQLLG